MDISLQIIVEAASHDLSANPEKEAARYRRGDIVGVYLTSDVGAPSLNGRLGFVHITGVPDSINISKIKNRLLGEIIDRVTVSDPDIPGGTVDTVDLIRRRAWRIPPSIIPVGVRNQLLTNREAAVTWGQIKPYVRKKIVSDRLNASLDNETTELTDSDVT